MIEIVKEMPSGYHVVKGAKQSEASAVKAAKRLEHAKVLYEPENRLFKAAWYVVIPIT